MRTAATALLLGSLLPTWYGCARYQPRPLDPAEHAGAYQARRLGDSTLRAWVVRHAGPLPSERWSDRHLAVAALAYRADLERARRDWVAARAASVAAGARPAPGIETGIERAVGGRDGGPPWVVSLTGLFTVELGGKRAARLQAARAREAAAHAEVALLMAATLARVRTAVLAVRHAEGSRDDAVAIADALVAVETLERRRFAEAALGSGEVARTATDVAAARAAAVARAGDAQSARVDLAAALAVPTGEVRELPLAPSSDSGCAWADDVGPDSLATLALRRRGEVAGALAGYAEAEADLHSRVAGRHPDLELGPGFIWDQGVHRWTLAAALPALLGLRARAPIAAAEASRHAAAGKVAEVQDALFAEVEGAFERCHGAALERAVADSQRVAAEQVAALARAAYDRGETGRLELARAGLLRATARAAERAARGREERAGLELEVATGSWPQAETMRWPDPVLEPYLPEDR